MEVEIRLVFSSVSVDSPRQDHRDLRATQQEAQLASRRPRTILGREQEEFHLSRGPTARGEEPGGKAREGEEGVASSPGQGEGGAPCGAVTARFEEARGGGQRVEGPGQCIQRKSRGEADGE